jgi:hypothetical protein
LAPIFFLKVLLKWAWFPCGSKHAIASSTVSTIFRCDIPCLRWVRPKIGGAPGIEDTEDPDPEESTSGSPASGEDVATLPAAMLGVLFGGVGAGEDVGSLSDYTRLGRRWGPWTVTSRETGRQWLRGGLPMCM